MEDVEKEINKLNKTKAIQSNDIPTKIVTFKENYDIFSHFITENINFSVNSSIFPESLKNADVRPVFKKNSRLNKENYRPVSILPNISKIYERCIFNQIYNFFDPIFSKFQCGFRKNHSAQHCLLAMIEKWKKCLDDQWSLWGAID